jgi:hypothetical protein
MFNLSIFRQSPVIWFQQVIKDWIKPSNPSLFTGTLSDLTRSRTDLFVENALLRQQLIVLNRQVKRPHFYDQTKARTIGRITSKAFLGGLHHSYSRQTFLN